MDQRRTMTTQQLYYDVIVFYQTVYDTELAEVMTDPARIRERKAVHNSYDLKCAELKKRHALLWRLAVDANECFTFPHPEWGEDLTRMFWVKELNKQVKASRLMIADAIHENVWWVDMELKGKHVANYRINCQTAGCMNPKHWIDTDKEIAR